MFKNIFVCAFLIGLLAVGSLMMGEIMQWETVRDHLQMLHARARLLIHDITSVDAAAAYIRETVPKLKYVFSQTGLLGVKTANPETGTTIDIWCTLSDLLNKIKNLPVS